MYIPLPLRLTFFFGLILAAALWFFGSTVYQQAEQNAFDSLKGTLSDRAHAVQLGKDLAFAKGGPLPADNIKVLSSVDAFGNGGVSLQVWGNNSSGNWALLAETANQQSQDPTKERVLGINDLGEPLRPWNQHAIDIVRQRNSPDHSFTQISYQGQTILVYTLFNNDFGQEHVIQAAKSESEIEQYLSTLRLILSRGAALVLAIAIAGGLLMTYGVLATVRRMTSTARSISTSRDFSRRVPNKTLLGRDELATLADTFNLMLASLEEAYTRQQRFVADASHELRAPITSIRCNLDLLTRAPDLPDEEVQGALADACAEAERMGRLVSDLLLLAHSDSTHGTNGSNGTSSKQPITNSLSDDYKNVNRADQEVDLDSLVLDVFRQYRPPQENGRDGKQLQGPHLVLQHITPARVHGDADQIKQALVALVDNALKYTPLEGQVALALTVAEDHAIVKVSDTGIGIAPEDLPHIFERFYRADRARTRDRGGSGLGLAIAQSIMQEHQGCIEVESTPGKGSTFLLKMPVAK